MQGDKVMLFIHDLQRTSIMQKKNHLIEEKRFFLGQNKLNKSLSKN